MLGKLIVAAMCSAMCCAVQADVNCPGLFEMKYDKSTYYVLTFLGGRPPGSTATDNQLRTQQQLELESRVTYKLQDYVRRLARNLEPQPPTVVLVGCDFSIKAQDLSRPDAESLSRHNVIAVLWGGKEDTKASVIHLSIPHYERREAAVRSQVEVHWLHVSATAATIDDWILELDRENIAQQAFLAMGIGLMSIKRSQWGLAKRSLCQVRSNLKLMAQEAVRPPPAEVEREILTLVNEAISEVDAGARSKGVNLDTNTHIKLACNP